MLYARISKLDGSLECMRMQCDVVEWQTGLFMLKCQCTPEILNYTAALFGRGFPIGVIECQTDSKLKRK